MSNTLENQVKALVALHFNLPPSKVRLDDSFLADLGGDALDLIELGAEIESVFNLHLSIPDRDSLVTSRAVVNFLLGRGLPV